MLGNDGGVSALFLHNYDTSGEGQSPAVYMSLNNLKNVNLEAFFLQIVISGTHKDSNKHDLKHTDVMMRVFIFFFCSSPHFKHVASCLYSF